MHTIENDSDNDNDNDDEELYHFDEITFRTDVVVVVVFVEQTHSKTSAILTRNKNRF